MAETKPELKYGCPRCGSTEDFTEANIIDVTAYVNGFAPDGSPDYGGESKLEWDSQRLNPSVSMPYRCNNCGEEFEKPTPVPETGPEREMTPAQLQAKYDNLAEGTNWGEHPRFTMEAWRFEVQEGNTRVGYWEWVATMIQTIS